MASQELSKSLSQSVSALDLLDNVSVLILGRFLKETKVMKQLMCCVDNLAMGYISSGNAFNLYSGVPGTNFGPETVILAEVFVFLSVSPDQSLNSTSNFVTTVSFHNLPNSSFTTILRLNAIKSELLTASLT